MASLDAAGVAKMTVPQLRAALEARGLDSKGLKAALSARLLEALEAGGDAPQADASAGADAAAEAAAPADDPPAAAAGGGAAAERAEPETSPAAEAAAATPAEPAPVAAAEAAPPPAARGRAADAAAASPEAPPPPAAPAAKRKSPEPAPAAAARAASPPPAAKKARAATPPRRSASPAAAAAPAAPAPAAGPPPARALRVEGFVRPFTLPAVKALLASAGGSFDEASDFWMPQIKNLAVVVYASEAEAEAARAALDGLQWPPGSGKALAAHYMTEADARRCIAAGSVAAQLRPAATTAAAGAAAAAAAGASPGGAARPAGGGRAPAKTLDTLFRKTVALPAIYFLPLSEEQVERKRARLAAAKRAPEAKGDRPDAPPRAEAS